jgi:putative SOS response-associated peptidase YedK
MAFAGLWKGCEIEDKIVEYCTIITTSPNALIGVYYLMHLLLTCSHQFQAE